MKIKLWHKVLTALGMIIVLAVMILGGLTQIGQGHFLNPPDPASADTGHPVTLAEKVEQARKNLNFGK